MFNICKNATENNLSTSNVTYTLLLRLAQNIDVFYRKKPPDSLTK